MSYESFINDTMDSVKEDRVVFYFCKSSIDCVDSLFPEIKEKLLILKDLPNFIEHSSQEEMDYFTDAYQKVNAYLGE